MNENWAPMWLSPPLQSDDVSSKAQEDSDWLSSWPKVLSKVVRSPIHSIVNSIKYRMFLFGPWPLEWKCRRAATIDGQSALLGNSTSSLTISCLWPFQSTTPSLMEHHSCLSSHPAFLMNMKLLFLLGLTWPSTRPHSDKRTRLETKSPAILSKPHQARNSPDPLVRKGMVLHRQSMELQML